MSSANTFV